MVETVSKREFFASLDKLHEMLSFIVDQACRTSRLTSDLNKLEIASEEALVNIVNYSYPNEKGSIQIACSNNPYNKEFYIIIEDQGIPYNPIACMRAPQHTAPSTQDHAVGGYGIFLMLKLVDRLDYVRHENSNELILTKYY